MSILLAIALLGAPPARADPSFAQRVIHGKQIELGRTGPAYQKRLWASIEAPLAGTLQQCIARNAPADKSPFTLVADVLPNGTTRGVDVQPATAVARCAAAWFTTMALPPPPRLPDATAYPIEIDVSIVP
jgi:hypothetical protein